MALNRSAKSRILRRYFPGMTRNSEMSTEPSHPSFSPGCILRVIPDPFYLIGHTDWSYRRKPV